MSRQVRKQSSPLTDAMEYYDAEMTREEYIQTNYLGGVAPGDDIFENVEGDWPEQFRRTCLLDTAPASDKIQ
jgi:hypothetical protein